VWVNDELGSVADLGADDTIIAVWYRGDQVTPWVQASRGEIANALPGIEFPELVPEGVTHVTSQLVFDGHRQPRPILGRHRPVGR
jgi:hypothetical protein